MATDSKLRLKDIAASTSDTFNIDPHRIEIVPGFNAREDFGDLAALCDQIIEAGCVKQPLLVRLESGRVLLVHGERRLRATHMAIERGAAIPHVPCRAEPRHTTPAQRAMDQLLYNDGKPFTMAEEARIFRELHIEHQLTERDIATKCGRSITHIRNCLALLKAPQPVLEAVREGKISSSLVVELQVETGGDPAALEEKVTAAIATAEAEGKTHASRKHVDPAPEPATPSQSVGTVPFQDVPSSSSGGPREARLSRDTTGNLKKINAMLEKLDSEKTLPPLVEVVELMVDVLEGNQPVSALKSKLLA